MSKTARSIVHALTSATLALTPVTGFSDRGDVAQANLGAEQSKLEQACEKVTVKSSDFVTGNMLIDWLGNENAVRIQSPTNTAREFLTIERGTEDGVLYVNVPSHKKVQVAHHLQWTLNPKKAIPGQSFQVQLTPQNIDYVLVANGDKYIIDTHKMRSYSAESIQKLGRHISAMAAGNDCSIDLAKNSPHKKKFDAFISSKYGSQATSIRQAVAKAGDSSLAEKYANMSDVEVMARHVPETLAQSMYKDAATLGVTIEDVRDVAAKGERIADSRFVGPYNPSAPGIEYGVWGDRIARKAVLDRHGLTVAFNSGLTPFNIDIGYVRGSRVTLDETQLKGMVGDAVFNEMNTTSVPTKTFSEKGVDGLMGQMAVIRDWHLCKLLAENTVAYDTVTMQFVGKPTKEDIPLKNFYGDRKIGAHPSNKEDRDYGIHYAVKGCSLQKVNPLK